MARLIDDSLMLSRVTRSDLARVPVDLSALARSIAARLVRSGSAREVEWVIEDGLVVDGDVRLIATAFENLLGNAWKFTSKKPSTRIEVFSFGRAAAGRAEAIRQGATESDGRVFVVRDNGSGFDMAYADKLFGVFQRLHSESDFEGTGVGLAIVRRVVNRHGGRVWADAHLDQGASFYLTFGGDSGA